MCNCSLSIQHAKSISRIILSSVACLNLKYFSASSLKGTIFGETLLNKKEKCVLIFSTILSETFHILRRIQRVIIIHMYMIYFYLKCQLFLSDFNKTNLFHRFSKNTEISNFMKIQCDPSCSMRTVGWMDGQTDRQRETEIDIDNTKLIVEFHNGPKNALLQNRTRHR